MGFSVSTTIVSEWARMVGIRTAVQLTGKSSARPQILRASHVTFISSLVYPFSWNLSICGMTLKGKGYAKMSFLTSSPFKSALVPSVSSSIPGWPAPLAAWYVLIKIFFKLKSLCRGQMAMSPMAVVQLGLAMSFDFLVSSPLISGTTKGTSFSYRKADCKKWPQTANKWVRGAVLLILVNHIQLSFNDQIQHTELSIQTTPSSPSEMARACSRAKSPETAKKTTSHSLAASTEKSSAVTSPYFSVGMAFPALRSLPKMRNLPTGKSLFSKHWRISFPTAPVAPTIPTVKDMDISGPARRLVEVLWGTLVKGDDDMVLPTNAEDVDAAEEARATGAKALVVESANAKAIAAATVAEDHFMAMVSNRCGFGCCGGIQCKQRRQFRLLFFAEQSAGSASDPLMARRPSVRLLTWRRRKKLRNITWCHRKSKRQQNNIFSVLLLHEARGRPLRTEYCTTTTVTRLQLLSEYHVDAGSVESTEGRPPLAGANGQWHSEYLVVFFIVAHEHFHETVRLELRLRWSGVILDYGWDRCAAPVVWYVHFGSGSRCHYYFSIIIYEKHLMRRDAVMTLHWFFVICSEADTFACLWMDCPRTRLYRNATTRRQDTSFFLEGKVESYHMFHLLSWYNTS